MLSPMMSKSKFKEYLLLNKNILIGFVGAFLIGAISSQAIAKFTSPLVNSLISVVAELGVFLSIFGVLFYFDNKDMFIAVYRVAQRDPVCNMMVDEKKAQHISEINGQEVYLCSAQCKSQFDQNPNRYGY